MVIQPMNPTPKKMLGAQLPAEQEKQLADVLPEVIRILQEGDAIHRVAKYLSSAGWTAMDVWRELVQKQSGHSDPFTLTLQNDLRDIERVGPRSNRHSDTADYLQHMLKAAKRKPR